MLNKELLKKYFNIYSDFFFIENQVSIIDGRTFDIIYIFFLELGRIIKDPKKSKIQELSISVNEYNEEMRTTYGTHAYRNFKISSNLNIFDTIFNDEFIKFLKNFYQSYDQISMYTNQHMNDVLLVEFNDMLAHILVALMNQNNNENFMRNVSNAKTHLYRASLDGYKEIIVEESYRDNDEYHNIPIDIKRELFVIRLKEIISIGSTISQRIKFINSYRSLAVKLMNRAD